MAAPYGLDRPAGSGHGHAPYEEEAVKSQARMNAYRMALAGLGGISVPRGANFGEAFLSSLSGSARASSAAQQAAEAYAMKKIEAERANEERQARLGLIEAQTQRASRPEPPAKVPPEPKKDITSMSDEEWARHLKRLEDESRAKAAGKPTPKGGVVKPPKPLAPLRIPRRIPAKVTEQQIIDSINQETDTAALMSYFTGRGSADSPAIRRAAQLRAADINQVKQNR